MNWSLSIFPSELLLYLKFCLTACKGSVLTNQLHNRVIARTSQSVCELNKHGELHWYTAISNYLWLDPWADIHEEFFHVYFS